MLALPVEKLMLSLGADAITDIILLLLVVLFVVSAFLSRKNKAQGFTHYTPTLLTTLGILGTFAGVLAGLLIFNVNDIDSSIGGLLDGLKTAFITSFVGMSLSIIYKLIQNSGWISAPITAGVDEDNIGISEIFAVMRQQAQGIDSLSKIIGGSENDSLVSQLKLFRSDVHDQGKKTQESVNEAANSLSEIQKISKLQQENFREFESRLWIKLQEFADMLSKSATEQVINALKEVISDFNNNLTEQFGENFKQLNSAVLKLVEWQENYKQQLLQMTEQYAQGVIAITKTEESVSHISNEASVIPKSMQELQHIMQVNQHQLNELEAHLSAFKDIRDRAVEALPEIRTHIDKAVDGMQKAADSMTNGITVSSEKLQTAIITGAEEIVVSSGKVHASLQSSSDVIFDNSEKIRTTMDDAAKESNAILRDMIEGMKEESKNLHQSFREAGIAAITEAERIRNDFESGIESMRGNLAKSLSDLAELQQKESQRVLAGMSNMAEQALSNTGESVKKQVSALDDAMKYEIQQVMTEMGKALTAISGRFTADYQKLTEQMQSITRMAGRG